MLPKRKERPKMGCREEVRIVYPTHRAFVKRHGCCIQGCTNTQIDFAHLRTAANSGIGRKPHDAFGVSLCREHHIDQHTLGIETFQARYKIDLFAMAAEFVAKTTDKALRADLVHPPQRG